MFLKLIPVLLSELCRKEKMPFGCCVPVFTKAGLWLFVILWGWLAMESQALAAASPGTSTVDAAAVSHSNSCAVAYKFHRMCSDSLRRMHRTTYCVCIAYFTVVFQSHHIRHPVS